MRRPAFSIIALMAPVRLRAVASGLMIENVRSIDIKFSFWELQGRRETASVYYLSLMFPASARVPYEWALNLVLSAGSDAMSKVAA